MRMFTFYIGAGSEEQIVSVLEQWFESFTLLQGQGVFRGQREGMWLVKLASADPVRVIQAAEELRFTFGQDGVGIEYAGRYFRVTAVDAATELKKLLAINKGR